MSEAMGDNVTKFPAPPTPPEPPVKIKDEYIFNMVHQWRIARAAQEISWAKCEMAELGGLREADHEFDLKALDRMHELEYHIAMAVPKTVLTARAMLEMAIQILAYQNIDPKHQFASGPVLEIVRNCLEGFEKVSGLTPLAVKKMEPSDANASEAE